MNASRITVALARKNTIRDITQKLTRMNTTQNADTGPSRSTRERRTTIFDMLDRSVVASLTCDSVSPRTSSRTDASASSERSGSAFTSKRDSVAEALEFLEGGGFPIQD